MEIWITGKLQKYVVTLHDGYLVGMSPERAVQEGESQALSDEMDMLFTAMQKVVDLGLPVTDENVSKILGGEKS